MAATNLMVVASQQLLVDHQCWQVPKSWVDHHPLPVNWLRLHGGESLHATPRTRF